jgi:DNA-directed RNA polymerase I and III subunit RPAC2
MPNETPSSASSSGSLLLPPYKGTVPKIEVLNMDDYRRDPTLLTVIFHEEDHTVGNALKHIIAQMPGVEFSGYNVPHPLEDKILVRVQTRKGVKAGDVLLKGTLYHFRHS